MPNHLISIITPVYNVEPYINRCLQSIINQSYTNWELILVNDGSTDNSGQICQNYAADDKRIIYLEQQNQGQAVARNKALEIIKGKYICFVDSDDWIDSNFLKYLYEAIENNNSEIAICAHYVSKRNNNKIKYVPTNSSILKANEFKNKLIIDEIRSFLCDKIFKKDIFKGIRFKPGIFYEDYCIYHEILSKLNTSVPVINKPLYYYFQREGSTTNSRKLKNVLDQFNAYKSRYELEYVTNYEKTFILKDLMIAFCHFRQIHNCDKRIISDCKNYILSTDYSIRKKAKNLMNIKALFLFLSAFYMPALYRILFKFYINFFKKKRRNN